MPDPRLMGRLLTNRAKVYRTLLKNLLERKRAKNVKEAIKKAGYTRKQIEKIKPEAFEDLGHLIMTEDTGVGSYVYGNLPDRRATIMLHPSSASRRGELKRQDWMWSMYPEIYGEDIINKVPQNYVQPILKGRTPGPYTGPTFSHEMGHHLRRKKGPVGKNLEEAHLEEELAANAFSAMVGKKMGLRKIPVIPKKYKEEFQKYLLGIPLSAGVLNWLRQEEVITPWEEYKLLEEE